MTIGELNRRIDVLENQEERDSFGAVIGIWVVVGRVWANIKLGVGNENFMNDKVNETQNGTIIVRFYPSITVMDRIKYQDKLFEIVAVKDIVTQHRWTEITVKEIANEKLHGTAEES